jgi:hypothetical protein
MAETQGIHLDVRTPDNKLIVQSSPRPIGTYACFLSEGDSTAHPHIVGGGTAICIDHDTGDSTNQVIYVDFNTIENKTYMQEGYGLWDGAYLDTMNLDIVPTLTAYTSGTGTNYSLYQGYLIIPAAGDGDITVQSQDIRLVEIPYSLDNPSIRQSQAFWDADYSTETHQFSNIRPAPLGDGQYNMFGSEVVFQRPVNLRLVGSHVLNLKTNDIAQIAHGIRLRFSFNTFAPDHDWEMSVVLAMHREHVSSF